MDEDDDDPVPLPNVNGAIMRKVGGCSHTTSICSWSDEVGRETKYSALFSPFFMSMV